MTRQGHTLIEMVVVIAILGITLGVSGLALASLAVPREAWRVRQARQARAEAITTGLPMRLPSDSPTIRPSVLFLPDGRAIGPGVDPLTGEPSAHDSSR